MNLTNWEIILRFYQYSKDLLWMSESDYPFVVFLWEVGEKIQLDIPRVLEFSKRPPDTEVRTLEFERFFRRAITFKDWHDEAEMESVKKYQHLVDSLRECLTDLRVYKIGEITIDVYIVGMTASGDFAGLSTVSIET